MRMITNVVLHLPVAYTSMISSTIAREDRGMWHSSELERKFARIVEQMMEVIDCSLLDYRLVGVFGSFARGDYTVRSDVDLCIVVDELPDRYLRGCLYDEAEDLGVDLCFVTTKRFETEDSRFLNNIRENFKEVRRRQTELKSLQSTEQE